MSDELKMSVSPICTKDGSKYAFVSFTDEERSAEGKIPDCKIINNDGFSDEEVEKLEYYMQQELPQIKKMAAGINIMHSFMGDKK
ncbi:MAG: hypothetical protein NC433_03970 [Clostridiales bacterium]|nr:hypothetical protein [Clostridiales bacterium]